MHFDDRYEEHVRLSGGDSARLRMLRVTDGALLQEGFAQLSQRSRYLRFLMPKAAISGQELAYLSRVDQRDHVALGAVRVEADGRERGLGVARFVRLPDEPATADMALTVLDEVQHQGLGRLLLSRARRAAQERGVHRFHVDMFRDNEEMLSLLRELGHVVDQRTEAGVFSAECELDAPPDKPA